MKVKGKGKTKDLFVFALFVFPAVAFVLFSTDVPFLIPKVG